MNKIITSLVGVAAMASVASAAIIKKSGDITVSETWTKDNQYILTDLTFVKNDAVLTIEEGTIIRGEPKSGSSAYDPGALVITRTGQIEAEGTPSEPIIFTTAVIDQDQDGQYSDESVDYASDIDYSSANFLDSDPAGDPLSPGFGFLTTSTGSEHVGSDEYRGLWGGVIILGSAPTSIIEISGDTVVNTNKTARDDLDDIFEGFIEGLDPDDTNNDNGIYGGSNPNDSSGTFKYASIRHGGTNIAADNEINGLTMGGVGNGTLIEFVEVYCNDDDGFEWFGGTANSRYLVSLYNNDDSFDIDEGFTGLGQFWFSLQLNDKENGDHGGEHDATHGAFDSIDVAFLNATDVLAAGVGYFYNDNDTTGDGYTGQADRTGAGIYANYIGAGDPDAEKRYTAGSGADQGLGLPIAYPTIFNATYVGSLHADEMIKCDDSFGGDYFNSIFVGTNNDLVDVSNDARTRVEVGDCSYINHSIAYDIKGSTGALSGSQLSNYSTMQTTLASADNNNVLDGTNPFASLTKENSRANVDPRITDAANAKITPAPATATYFISAPYLGAFDPSLNTFWTDGWTVFSANFDLDAGSR